MQSTKTTLVLLSHEIRISMQKNQWAKQDLLKQKLPAAANMRVALREERLERKFNELSSKHSSGKQNNS